MKSEQHILVVSPTPSYPPTSGNRRRVNGLYRYLKEQGFVVHFVLYNLANSADAVCNAESYRHMADSWDYFELIPRSLRSRSLASRLRNWVLRSKIYQKLALRGVRLPLNHRIDDWCCDALENYVRWKLHNYPIQAVFVEYVFLSKVLDSVPSGVLKLIDTHDLFADRHQRLIRGGLVPHFFTTSQRMENRAFRRADIVLAIQEIECREIRSRVDRRVLEVNHFEDRHVLDRRYETLSRLGVIGSGNMINELSIRELIEEMTKSGVLDHVSLDVVGSVCAKLDCDHPNVRMLGSVADLDSFYGSVDLVVNPSISGTGLKIKSVEAMSYGVPLLSTANGIEGIASEFAYHHFPDITSLVAHTGQMVENGESLEGYHRASLECFARYEQRLRSQLDQLVAILRRDSTQPTTVGV